MEKIDSFSFTIGCATVMLLKVRKLIIKILAFGC